MLPRCALVAKCVYRCWVLTHLASPHSDTRWKESGHLNFIFDDLQARMVVRQPLTLAFYHQLPAEHYHLKWEQYAMRKRIISEMSVQILEIKYHVNSVISLQLLLYRLLFPPLCSVHCSIVASSCCGPTLAISFHI